MKECPHCLRTGKNVDGSRKCLACRGTGRVAEAPMERMWRMYFQGAAAVWTVIGILILAAVIGGLAYSHGIGKASDQNQGEVEIVTGKTTKGKTQQGPDLDARTITMPVPVVTVPVFVQSFDILVEENSRLEPTIVSTSVDINRMGPNIPSSVLSGVLSMENNFETIKSEAERLTAPDEFYQSKQDFITLISYNISRCDSMYKGSLSWRNGDSESVFRSFFTPGMHAKDAYNSLYPVFEREYTAAKASQ